MPIDGPENRQQTPPAKRRKAPKGEMRRAALLDAATQVFARDGYSSASMRDVAAIAGITTVGLLHHFPNKVALLTALLERRDQRVTSRFEQLEMEMTLEGFVRFARESMRFSVEDAAECQAAMVMNTESLSQDHPACQWYKERFELTHRHAQEHFTALVEQGQIRPDVDVRQLAQELFSVMDGLQIQWLRSPDSVDVMQVFDRYLQRLANDLKVEQAHP